MNTSIKSDMGTKNSISKIITFDSLDKIRRDFPDKKIVHCHGVFDVIHHGHLEYFKSAKKLGDILIVSITTERFVNKGPDRPYFNDAIRSSMVAALEIVDYVVISPFPTAVPTITNLKPHYYVKGPDYKNKYSDISGGILAEEKAVNEVGGVLVFTDDMTHSSSAIINKLFYHWSEEQLKIIEDARQAGGISIIEEIMDRISKETINIIGEPIVDTYVYCVPESLSTKSPSISAKYLYEEDYAGGSLAIANHLASFVDKVNLLITHGGEDYFLKLLREKMNPLINVLDVRLDEIPTPRKSRFIDINNSQRIFEVTNLSSDQWMKKSADDFCRRIRDLDDQAGSFIVADFGHGLFEGEVLRTMEDVQSYVGLNVQTNSSNYGFNLFTKHKRFDYLSIDTREARLAMHDRYTSNLDLARIVRKKINKTSAFTVTLGGGGSCYFPKSVDSEILAPAFADKIVDATGAGDAYFALTTLLIRVGCPHKLVPFLGNIFAGLKTKIIGNKMAITKAQLMKATAAILK